MRRNTEKKAGGYMRRRIAAGLIVLALMFICPLAYAQDSSDTKAWKFEVTPYFWAPTLDAVSTVSGQSVAMDLSFSDIWDNFDVFGLSARVEAWKGKCGLIFDGMYLDLDGDFSLQTPGPPTIGVDVDIEQTMLDFAVSYRLVEAPRLSFETIVGARYTDLKQEITLDVTYSPVGPPGTVLGGSENWVEPFVGGRMVYGINERWKFLLRGDVGGFGIGSASDLTWNLLAGFDYRPWQRASIKLAYRIYSIDYERGSGTDKFGFDGELHGPMVGVTFYF
jgi:opacity protein-like surface antigen